MINFLRYRYVCYAISLSFLCVGLAYYFLVGGFVYHIDFVGGSQLHLVFEKELSSSALRDALQNKAWGDLVIQTIGRGEKEFLVRTTQVQEDIHDRFLDDLAEEIPENKVRIEQVAFVGAEVGKDIQWDALKAILLSFLLILLYIAIRSQYHYALGAVVAIAHDMLVVLVAFLLLGEQLSLHVLAAVLAILGYSLNDTIVIFGKIRENMQNMKGVSREHIVNLSINQTMRRTLLTSFSTLLAVGSIFVLGGQALHGFSLAMLMGIVAGTYSSIYIASPIMLAVRGHEDLYSK